MMHFEEAVLRVNNHPAIILQYPLLGEEQSFARVVFRSAGYSALGRQLNCLHRRSEPLCECWIARKAGAEAYSTIDDSQSRFLVRLDRFGHTQLHSLATDA